MALPTIEGFMIHALRAINDGKPRAKQDIFENVSKASGLTKEDMEIRNSAGALLYKSYIHWALTYMIKAGLVTQETKGVGIYKITPEGSNLLDSGVKEITHDTLLQFPQYKQYQEEISKKRMETMKRPVQAQQETLTDPMSAIETAQDQISENLKSELLDMLHKTKPFFFEKIVVDLIGKMGYGSGHDSSAKAFCMGSDGGVDGVVEEDRLGLDKIYIQAKRWTNNVGRPELQQFAGTLMGKHAHKGVFITTSDFTKEARDFVKDSGSSISLINGEKLVSLMIEFGLGVAVLKRIDILKIDHDYFNDEEY
jgi:restriction system protein